VIHRRPPENVMKCIYLFGRHFGPTFIDFVMIYYTKSFLVIAFHPPFFDQKWKFAKFFAHSV